MSNAHQPRHFTSGPRQGLGTGMMLSVQQVADQLNVSRSLIYEEIKRGHLQTKRIGKCIRISVRDLDRYVHAATPEDPEIA